MLVDPITEEIRAIRQALAARYDNHLNRIFDALRKSERESGRQFISLPMRLRERSQLPNPCTHRDRLALRMTVRSHLRRPSKGP